MLVYLCIGAVVFMNVEWENEQRERNHYLDEVDKLQDANYPFLSELSTN